MVQNFMIIKIKRGNVIIVTHLNENYCLIENKFGNYITIDHE